MSDQLLIIRDLLLTRLFASDDWCRTKYQPCQWFGYFSSSYTFVRNTALYMFIMELSWTSLDSSMIIVWLHSQDCSVPPTPLENWLHEWLGHKGYGPQKTDHDNGTLYQVSMSTPTLEYSHCVVNCHPYFTHLQTRFGRCATIISIIRPITRFFVFKSFKWFRLRPLRQRTCGIGFYLTLTLSVVSLRTRRQWMYESVQKLSTVWWAKWLILHGPMVSWRHLYVSIVL